MSYGTRQLQLESGEQIMMPNIVRTVTRSTMIEQYFKHCSDENFDPLGRSTLFQILKVRESSQRKSLLGLDNIAANGADGFDMLHKIVDDLEQFGSERGWCETMRTNLKDGKRYLKKQNIVRTAERTRLPALTIANVTHSVILRTACSKRNAPIPITQNVHSASY